MAIRKLPIQLVNKIAAGEVIERPASVVKELLENALDAGAKRISVTIEDGGKRLIQVTDDGCGMGEQDAALAFSPHATSKIVAEDDLFRIQTMGFRGEALASVASISHARLRTRRGEDQGGWEVSAEAEGIEAPVPCPAGAGTTVIVRDLFYNTPARRKFLRTTNTEFGHISEQLARLALPNPQIAFTLEHNGREVLHLPASESTAMRIGDLFTTDLAECLLPIAGREGEICVNGLLGPPAAARSSAKWQYIFLNGRYIRDRLLGHALRESFRGLLPGGRYPVAMLFIEIDPAEVDVNVHPTKIEVRFRNSNMVYGEVLAALRETLNKANLTPGAQAREVVSPLDIASPVAGEQADPTGRQASLRQAMSDFFKSQPPPTSQPRLDFHPARIRHGGDIAERPASAPATYEPGQYETTPPPQIPPAPAVASPAVAIMQIHDSYIVAQTPDGLLIADQHAMHERILYNDFKRRLVDSPDSALTAQKMLIPQSFEVTPAESALLEGEAKLLERLGIEVAPFGPNTYAVQQYPIVLAERGVEMVSFLREWLDRLAEDRPADGEAMLEQVLAMMACKAAVKAGERLSVEEMQDLLSAAERTPNASTCPHGRPTMLKMGISDLQKQFKRT